MTNFITVDNGVGLSRDMKIFADTLGIKYNFVDYLTNKGLKPADVNVFFEVTKKGQLSAARHNVLIPNPEWFPSEWLSFIDRFDLVLCKTHHAQEVFSKYVGKRAVYIGWTSDDRKQETTKIRKFLHTAGKSETKNTKAVYQAFTNYHHLSQWNNESLLITTAKPQGWLQPNDYVAVSNSRLSEKNMQTVQNTFQFHVCPSEYEGFGHYINEALSCGAIVITTNAAPMNELCRPDYSILCPAFKHRHMGIVETYGVHAESIHNAVEVCESLTDDQIDAMSMKSRAAYEQGKKEFEMNAKGVWTW